MAKNLISMPTFANLVLPAAAQGHLRTIEVWRDLSGIADLIELCFRDTLDADGLHYLDEMRSSARYNRFWNWMSTAAEQAANLPVTGFVWEENKRLVGNLSLVSIEVLGKRSYLIANVAVHPDFRGRGIGRMLTATAVDYVMLRGMATVWLQVRADNPSAIHIYQSLGFVERARRTSWQNRPEIPGLELGTGLRLQSRQDHSWVQQKSWLERLYPVDLRWHLDINLPLMQPGWEGDFRRLLSFAFPRHWSVERSGRLLGVVTWLHAAGYSDFLWLAVPEQIDEEAVKALLVFARRQIARRPHLTLNFPAGLAEGPLEEAGFFNFQTLIWMEKPLRKPESVRPA